MTEFLSSEPEFVARRAQEYEQASAESIDILAEYLDDIFDVTVGGRSATANAESVVEWCENSVMTSDSKPGFISLAWPILRINLCRTIYNDQADDRYDDYELTLCWSVDVPETEDNSYTRSYSLTRPKNNRNINPSLMMYQGFEFAQATEYDTQQLLDELDVIKSAAVLGKRA